MGIRTFQSPRFISRGFRDFQAGRIARDATVILNHMTDQESKYPNSTLMAEKEPPQRKTDTVKAITGRRLCRFVVSDFIGIPFSGDSFKTHFFSSIKVPAISVLYKIAWIFKPVLICYT